MRIRETIEKYVFPPSLYCMSCGAIIDSSREYMLCDECMEKFSWNTGATCECCGKALGRALAGLCYNCMEKSHEFEKGYSCLSYGSREKAPILGLKHGEKAYIAKALGQMLCDRLAKVVESEYDGVIPWDIIIPVPIHISRLLKRGYNQTELIGAEVSKGLGTEMKTNILLRKRPAAKSGGTVQRRQKNIEGAFAVSDEAGKSGVLRNKNILLIDDVYTTGATADECSRALLSAGAAKVHIAVIATGSNYHSSSS